MLIPKTVTVHKFRNIFPLGVSGLLETRNSNDEQYIRFADQWASEVVISEIQNFIVETSWNISGLLNVQTVWTYADVTTPLGIFAREHLNTVEKLI